MEKLKDYKKNWLTFEQFKEKYQKVPVAEYPNSVLKDIPNPKVSVHIITYQHANYIRQAIDSVLMQQTDFPFEIIIGDDESTDGTREICIEYAEQYPDKIRLFLHRRENNIKIMGRPSHIFQYAFNSYNLRGVYVACVSGDDYWSDELKLQKQNSFMVKNDTYSYCFHSWSKRSLEKKPEIESSCRVLTMMHRNVFDKLPDEFFKTIQEDRFLYHILRLEGEKGFVENIRPAYYREHSGGLWSQSKQIYRYTQSLNTSIQLLNAFKGTPLERNLNQKIIGRSTDILLFEFSKKRSFKPIRTYFKNISNASNKWKFFWVLSSISNKLLDLIVKKIKH
ncbi:MAG: glycosyltransferase family 2 protein [Bacteroidota bacterium]